MGLFKADFYRFFALGFVGGALLILGTMGLNMEPVSQGIVPPAEAATQP